jgi:outer membrane immunogenic protein
MKKKIIAALVAVGALSAAAPALAADLAAKPVYSKAPAIYSPSYDWSGFYLGINGGYDFGRSRTTAVMITPATGIVLANPTNIFSTGGYEAGGQIGYNWQLSNWVWGLEADIQGLGANGTTILGCPACGPGMVTFNQKVDWFGTVRGKGGILFTPSVLGYVTGGGAYGEIKSAFTLANTTNSAVLTDSVTKGGFAVGGGVEALFASNWLARVEYLYVDFGKVGTGGALLVGANNFHDTNTSRVYENIVRAAISYKFGGPAPVVAKY